MAEKLCILGMIEWHSEPTRQDADQKRTKKKKKKKRRLKKVKLCNTKLGMAYDLTMFLLIGRCVSACICVFCL